MLPAGYYLVYILIKILYARIPVFSSQDISNRLKETSIGSGCSSIFDALTIAHLVGSEK